MALTDNTAKWDVKKIVDRPNSGLPVGFEYVSINPNVPMGSLPLLGGLYNRSGYVDLWAWVQCQPGFLISEEEWQAYSAANNGVVPFYSTGDGLTTFRVPSYSLSGNWLVKAYNTVTNLGAADLQQIGATQTSNDFRLTVLEDKYNVLHDNPINKNNIYRGKVFGDVVWNDFLEEHEVASNKFTDLYLGDEININRNPWLVAGFNLKLNKGDTALTKPHINLIPKIPLLNYVMNDTNTAAGGYKGCKMRSYLNGQFVTDYLSDLGSRLLKHRVLVTNSVSTTAASMAGAGWTGSSNGWEWVDDYATLLTEVEVYGSTVFSSSGYDIGDGNMKLPIFNFINNCYFSRWAFWLRAVASAAHFCGANGSGYADAWGASYSLGVRPLICVG